MTPQRQPERIVSGAAYDEDVRIEASVRPKRLDEYIGQRRVKEKKEAELEGQAKTNLVLTPLIA